MNRERELLERVMYRIPSLVISEHDLDLVDEIKELLAQPEIRELLTQKREPLSEQVIWNATTEQLFEEGVRWAEKAHGIGGRHWRWGVSRERELLKKALDFMLDAGANLNPLFKEINDNLLAQPEQTEQEPIAYVADPSVGFDVSRSAQGMPLIWLGKLEYGDTLYRVGKDDE